MFVLCKQQKDTHTVLVTFLNRVRYSEAVVNVYQLLDSEMQFSISGMRILFSVFTLLLCTARWTNGTQYQQSCKTIRSVRINSFGHVYHLGCISGHIRLVDQRGREVEGEDLE